MDRGSHMLRTFVIVLSLASCSEYNVVKTSDDGDPSDDMGIDTATPDPTEPTDTGEPSDPTDPVDTGNPEDPEDPERGSYRL
jgi:hypothetical protein